jgi:DMSO/TMAO reductase YedYZ molybdopterin-dependent catalytic subunit
MKKILLKKSVSVSILCLILSLISSAALFAQNASVKIGGDVGRPFELDAAAFNQMKQVSVKVKDHEGKEHEYSGVSLYELLVKAEAIPNNQLRGKALTKYLLVTAADGYQVVLALPEIDPAYTDQMVILANKQDGEPLAANMGPFRLILQRDKRPARSAMRVISMDILTAKKP